MPLKMHIGNSHTVSRIASILQCDWKSFAINCKRCHIFRTANSANSFLDPNRVIRFICMNRKRIEPKEIWTERGFNQMTRLGSGEELAVRIIWHRLQFIANEFQWHSNSRYSVPVSYCHFEPNDAKFAGEIWWFYVKDIFNLLRNTVYYMRFCCYEIFNQMTSDYEHDWGSGRNWLHSMSETYGTD